MQDNPQDQHELRRNFLKRSFRELETDVAGAQASQST